MAHEATGETTCECGEVHVIEVGFVSPVIVDALEEKREHPHHKVLAPALHPAPVIGEFFRQFADAAKAGRNSGTTIYIALDVNRTVRVTMVELQERT